MSVPSAVFAVMVNHLWQGLLIAVVLAVLLAARRLLAAETRHALAFAGLVAAAALPLAMLLPANEALMARVAHSIPQPAVESTPLSSEIVLVAAEAPPAEKRPIVELSEALLALRDAPADDRGQETVAAINAAAKTIAAWTDGEAVAPPPPATAPSARGAVVHAAPTAEVRPEQPRAVETAPRFEVSFVQLALDAARHPATLWALAALWLAGALVLLVRILLDVRAAEDLRRRATPVELPRPLAHLIGALDVRESDEAAGPMALGLVRTAVILPRGFVAERSLQELLGLIEHERAHVVRSDVRFALAQRILTALLWWSPAVHWISARVDEEREMACDEAAAARVGDARAFARTLTEHAQTQLFWGWPRLAVGAARSRSLLGRRVRRLIEIAGGGVQRVRLASRASAGVLLAVVAAAAIATPRLDAQDRDEDLAVPAAPEAPRAAPVPRPAAAPRAPSAPRGDLGAASRAVEEAEQAIDDAADRLGDAIDALTDRDSSAEEREAARRQLAAAREEMRVAGQTLRDAVVAQVQQELSVEFAREFSGANVGVAVDTAEIERMAEEIATAATSWVDGFDFDFNFDYDPEAFAYATPGPVSVYAGWGGGRQSNPLMTAVGMGDLDMVETLIDAGADVNASVRGSSPLTLATANGEADIVRRLLDAGADVNGPEGARMTPLSIAAQNGEQEILEMLIEAGADIDAPLPGGDTILMAAVRSGDVDMVRMLIERGADVEGGATPKAND
jgi:beta-lactamase regulating signal transducer with metallopeptidase domain